MPHKERCIAFASLIAFSALAARNLRRRADVSDFEWFLIAECVMAIATALLTSFGRLQFGAGQAFASRYQTPAMIYWAALVSLAMLWFHRRWPDRIVFAQAGVLAVMLLSVATFPHVWRTTILRAEDLRSACENIMGTQFDVHQAKKLYESPAAVRDGRRFLLQIWSGTRVNSRVWKASLRELDRK